MARRSRRGKKVSGAKLWALLACIAVLTAACVLILMNEPNSPLHFIRTGASSASALNSNIEINVIDVGNADSILVTNDGQSLLIDAGENNDGDKVISFLRSRNVNKLNYVIATHPDSDHIGGMDDVINAFPIDTYIMSVMPKAITPTTKTYTDVLKALDKKKITPTVAKPGNSYPLGGANLAILGPVGTFDTTNNMSVVCRITYGNRHFLFMGDAQKEAEDALLASGADLSADFIKVGHHGSRSSSQEKFLKAVNPRYAAITCGANNDYGHPHPETLATLKKLGITYYRCDLNGTITVTSDGNTIDVKTEK